MLTQCLGISHPLLLGSLHPHSITSWHQCPIFLNRRTTTAKGLSRLNFIQVGESSGDTCQRLIETEKLCYCSRWKYFLKPVYYLHGLTIEQKNNQAELKTRGHDREKQWWKLMAIYRTWRQTDRHTGPAATEHLSHWHSYFRRHASGSQSGNKGIKSEKSVINWTVCSWSYIFKLFMTV